MLILYFINSLMSNNLLDKKWKLLERRKEILLSNTTHTAAREEIVIFIKQLLSLEQEILRQKSETLSIKEEEINQEIAKLDDKKLFIELTESFQTIS